MRAVRFWPILFQSTLQANVIQSRPLARDCLEFELTGVALNASLLRLPNGPGFGKTTPALKKLVDHVPWIAPWRTDTKPPIDQARSACAAMVATGRMSGSACVAVTEIPGIGRADVTLEMPTIKAASATISSVLRRIILPPKVAALTEQNCSTSRDFGGGGDLSPPDRQLAPQTPEPACRPNKEAMVPVANTNFFMDL
jgi:hypothetical protein